MLVDVRSGVSCSFHQDNRQQTAVSSKSNANDDDDVAAPRAVLPFRPTREDERFLFPGRRPCNVPPISTRFLASGFSSDIAVVEKRFSSDVDVVEKRIT